MMNKILVVILYLIYAFLPEQVKAFSSRSSTLPTFKKIRDGVSYTSISPLVNSQGSDLSVSYLHMDENPRGLSYSSAKTWLGNLIRSAECSEVSYWRLLFGSFFASLIIFRQIIDAKLVTLWSYLTTSPELPAKIFRTDSYEWCLAIACFSVYIHAFGWADRLVRKAGKEGRVHPWRKYRLQDRYEADRHRRTIEKRLRNGDNVSADSLEPPLETVHSAWNWKAWIFEFWVYALPLATWDILAPRRHRRLGAFSAPTTMGILGGIAGGLIIYDFLFFFGHLLMHKVPFIYKAIHKKHHKIQEVRACEQVRLSLGEEVIDVGFSIVALNVLGVHPLARSMYNIIITFLLSELHCGFDFPWTPQNVVPFGIATGSRRHHYHHRFGKQYYQKFFFTLDRLFGFFQKDDGSPAGDSVKAKPFVPQSWT